MSAICRNYSINERSLLSCYLKNRAMRELIYHSAPLMSDAYWLAIQEPGNKRLDISQCSINERHLLACYSRTQVMHQAMCRGALLM
jgi:hypothetical protein